MQEPLTLTFQKHSFRSIFHPSNHPKISGQTTLAIFDRSFLAVAKATARMLHKMKNTVTGERGCDRSSWMPTEYIHFKNVL